MTVKETENWFLGHTKGNPGDCVVLDSTKEEYFSKEGMSALLKTTDK